MTARHARDGQFRDDLAAWLVGAMKWLRAMIAGIHLWLHWWDWPVVQAHYRRQYKRADRKAFAAECEAIRARATMHKLAETPAAPASPSGQPDAAPSPRARQAPSPSAPTPAEGEGATPRRDTWVITQPPPGSPLGYAPVRRAPRHAATQPRRYLPDGTEDELLVLPLESVIRTAAQPALGDLPPVSVRRCSTDVAAFGPALIKGLRAL